MRLIDEEEIKIKKIIIVLIIILLLLCVGIIALIIYRINNPTKITTYIDGKVINNFDSILDFQTDENGKTEIYIPIREFASYLNLANPEFQYETYKGNYNPKTEEDNKCYTIRDNNEVVIYSEKTKVLYKLNLEKSNQDYEQCVIDKDIFQSNGKLYTSVDGIEKGYNIVFSFDEKKKVITIYTLDYLINNYITLLQNKNIGEYGIMTIANDGYENWKSAFDDLLIVQSSNGKYGIIELENYSLILEPQYDNIQFINDSKTFLVNSNNKVGIFSEDGKRKIDLIYDQITSLGQNSKLYMVKTNNQYGVVDENGNIIIYPEYNKIGIDVSQFAYNGVKNGYILLDKLIPVNQNNKWAFFDTQGKMLTDGFIYKNIGCTKVRSGNNIYALLEIPDYNVLVVGDEYDKYTFMDLTGNDKMLPFVFDEIFLKTTTGEISYWMSYNDKDYNVLKNLEQVIK